MTGTGMGMPAGISMPAGMVNIGGYISGPEGPVRSKIIRLACSNFWTFSGGGIKDATLYTTFSPCLMCTKMILNSGIQEVVFNAAYPMGEVSLKLLSEAYIKARLVRQD